MSIQIHRAIHGVFFAIIAAVFSPLSSAHDRPGHVAAHNHDVCASVLQAAVTQNSDSQGVVSFQHASQPVAPLERLGWEFIAQARDTRDPAFYTLAQQTAECIESKAPGAAEALLLKGHALHNLHRFKEAEVVARRLVKQRGLWFDHALLGDVLIERGNLEQAVTAYQQLAEQRPGPQAFARIAQLRWLTGDLEGAIEMMTAAARATSTRAPEAAAWMHVRLAQLLVQADELRAAEAALEYAQSLQPEYPPALYTLGRLRLAQQQAADAVMLLQQAVQKEPLPEYRWALYEALLESDQKNLAAQQKASLLKHGEAEDRRSFALFLSSHDEELLKALALAIQELEQREDAFTLDAVAWAYSRTGDHIKAQNYSARALATGLRDARVLFHAGTIAARIGNAQYAYELLIEAQTFQQTLLPSEHRRLRKEIAAVRSQLTRTGLIGP